MNEPGYMHQPSDFGDLRRHPPASTECREVRDLMRDFADADLEQKHTQRVELHVHRCRSCALALARYEHEVLRLRRAYAAEAEALHDGGDAPQPGFAARVVERLFEQVEQSHLEPTNSKAAETLQASGTDSSRQSNSGSAGRPEIHRRGLAAGSYGMLALVGAGLILLLGWSFLGGDAELRRLSRLSVREAHDAWREDGDIRERLVTGSGIGADGVLVVGEGGFAHIEYHDADAQGGQPAALLTVDGGRLSLEDGEPRLHEGRMTLASRRILSMTLSDGTRIVLGDGDYKIEVDEFYGPSYDQVLDLIFETLSGDPAEVTRPGELAPQTVVVGEVGRFHGASGTVVEADPAPGPVSSVGGVWRDPVVQRYDLMGSVVDSGGPVADSVVQLVYQNARHQRGVSLLTDTRGEFILEPGSGLTGAFVVAHAWPPSHRPDLGVTAPNAYPLTSEGDGFVVSRPIGMSMSRTLFGRVVDRNQQPVDGVRLLPCVYDELVGCLLPWFEERYSNRSGRFQLAQMPASLPSHQVLAVVALHHDYEPVFQPLPLPNSRAAELFDLQIQLPDLRPAILTGLDPGSEVELFEQILDMPGMAARRRVVTVSATGQVSDLLVGRGPLWVSAGPGRLLQLREAIGSVVPGSVEIVPGTGPARDRSSVFRDLWPVQGTEFLLSSHYRHENFRAPGAGSLNLVVTENGRRSTEAHVFLLSRVASGGVYPRFVGIQQAVLQRSLELDPTAAEVELLAVSPLSGRLAFAQLSPQGYFQSVTMLQLEELGQLQVGILARPVNESILPLRFDPLYEGPLGRRPARYRFATDRDDWVVKGLPQGDYTVSDDRGRSWSVTIGAGTTLLQ